MEARSERGRSRDKRRNRSGLCGGSAVEDGHRRLHARAASAREGLHGRVMRDTSKCRRRTAIPSSGSTVGATSRFGSTACPRRAAGDRRQGFGPASGSSTHHPSRPAKIMEHDPRVEPASSAARWITYAAPPPRACLAEPTGDVKPVPLRYTRTGRTYSPSRQRSAPTVGARWCRSALAAAAGHSESAVGSPILG
jgi:hypothetical protein